MLMMICREPVKALCWLMALASWHALGRLRLQHFSCFLFTRLGHRVPDEFGKRLAFNQQLHLAGIKDFTLEQRLGDSDQNVAMVVENIFGALIARGDKLLHFLVNLDSRVLAEIALCGEVASQKDFLLVLAERQRPKV